MTMLFVAVLCALIGAVLLSVEAGYRIGRRRWAKRPDTSRGGSPTLEASIFGLMGLLIAFTFYGAGSRFEDRRRLMTSEANAISTAYLRLDLLPPETQPPLRQRFKEYVRARLAVFEKIPNAKAVDAALDHCAVLQRSIWNDAVAASRGNVAAQSLLLGATNQMIDVMTEQTVALSTHPPNAIFMLLGLTIIVSGALAGYSMSALGGRDWILIIAFSVVLGSAVFITLDYEYPRVGSVRINRVDRTLAQTLEGMK